MRLRSLALGLFALASGATADSLITASSINSAQASAIASDLSAWSVSHNGDATSFAATAGYIGSASFKTKDMPSVTDFAGLKSELNMAVTAPAAFFDGAVPSPYASFVVSWAEDQISIVNKDTEGGAARGEVGVAAAAVGAVAGLVGMVLL